MKSQYMRYEDAPTSKLRPLSIKLPNDINKRTTASIVWFLVKRHHTELLCIGVGIEFALLIVWR